MTPMTTLSAINCVRAREFANVSLALQIGTHNRGAQKRKGISNNFSRQNAEQGQEEVISPIVRSATVDLIQRKGKGR